MKSAAYLIQMLTFLNLFKYLLILRQNHFTHTMTRFDVLDSFNIICSHFASCRAINVVSFIFFIDYNKHTYKKLPINLLKCSRRPNKLHVLTLRLVELFIVYA